MYGGMYDNYFSMVNSKQYMRVFHLEMLHFVEIHSQKSLLSACPLWNAAFDQDRFGISFKKKDNFRF